jgi:hypothetical protein
MKIKSVLKLLLSLGILLIGERSFSQKKWPGVVLYNFDLNGVTKNMIIDPAVRISKGEFSYPLPIPPDSWDKADANKILSGYFDRFNREEYPKGKKLELYIDGNKCGTVKVTELDTLSSCSPVVSEVEVSYLDSAAHHFQGHGLVIPSLPPGKAIRKFTVDTNLEKSLTSYGEKEFLSRGVKKEIAERVEIKNLRSIDIDGDGQPEYLVSYYIMGEDVTHGEIESNIQYSLSLILKPGPAGLKKIFEHYPEPDIPEQTHIYKFVDVIDLDGDGNCEVLIQQITSMTAWDYILLKRKGDVWVQVYEGAGGGC